VVVAGGAVVVVAGGRVVVGAGGAVVVVVVALGEVVGGAVDVVVVVGGAVVLCGMILSASVITARMIGPAIDAPEAVRAWSGTTTAMATTGSYAGANPIIQSVVFVLPTPAWAVPVLTAMSHCGGKMP